MWWLVNGNECIQFEYMCEINFDEMQRYSQEKSFIRVFHSHGAALQRLHLFVCVLSGADVEWIIDKHKRKIQLRLNRFWNIWFRWCELLLFGTIFSNFDNINWKPKKAITNVYFQFSIWLFNVFGQWKLCLSSRNYVNTHISICYLLA